jgi:hypothetical protein
VVTNPAGPIEPFGSRQITARCPTGKVVTGGGFFVDLPVFIQINESVPTVDAFGTGWHILATNSNQTMTVGQVSAYAVCVNAS